jgi:hypothetical protein
MNLGFIGFWIICGLVFPYLLYLKWKAADNLKGNICQTCRKPLENKYAITCDPACHNAYLKYIFSSDYDMDLGGELSGCLLIKDKKEIR